MFRIVSSLFPILLSALLAAPVSFAGESPDISGPVSADIIRVIDGDTVLVSARPWPQQRVDVYVRLRGIDAPEAKAKCGAAREAARLAHSKLADLLQGQTSVILTHISADKYFGRIVADLSLINGENPAQDMLAGGYAVAYDGGHKPPSCVSSW